MSQIFSNSQKRPLTEFGQLFLGLYDDSLDLCLCAVSHTHFPEMARKRVRSLFAHRAEKKHPAVEGSVWTIKEKCSRIKTKSNICISYPAFQFFKDC